MAYTGNEVITFQFGHYSNFIGAHWWNCQEAAFEYIPDTLSEINHDVLFREGETRRGEVTFTPRLLLVDLKGSLGALPETGRLYKPSEQQDHSVTLWPADRVIVQSQDEEPKNEFLQDLEQGETAAATLPDGLKEKGQALPKLYHLDEVVKSWPDFLRPHLHPRSINVVQEYQHNDKTQSFDTFSEGQNLWSKPSFNEEFTNRIRLYMEETDNLQGYQVLMDNFDGFSGLACAGLQELRDDYPTKPVVCWACQPPQPAPETSRQISVRLVNQALALSSLAEHSKMFVPVSGTTKAWKNLGDSVTFPHLRYKPELLYHTSAIVASALDSVSLLYRLRSSTEWLGSVANRMTFGGRHAVAMSVMMPLPLHCEGTLLDTLEGWEGPLTRSLTPVVDPYTDSNWQQSYVLRGVAKSRLMRVSQMDPSSSNPAYSCRSLSELLKTYLSFNGQDMGLMQVVTSESAFKTSAPFPNFFHENYTMKGLFDSSPRPEYLGVDSVPLVAGLHCTKSLGSLLESLHTEAKRVGVRSMQFAAPGLECTELDESLEQLLCLSENYLENQMDF